LATAAWRFAAVILTTRLAAEVGPLEQVGLVAVEDSPVRAVPEVSAVPEDCPDVPAHSTAYGNVFVPSDRVNALVAPLPVAVT
jgi:hypothetical protein